MTQVTDRFEQALAQAREQERNSIGVQKERLLHAFLKYYLELDPACHEQKIAGFVADAFRGGELTEVQTRDLYRLRRKLEAFLEHPDVKHVNVVFPIASVKWLVWVEEGGLCRPRRKSPKAGGPPQILPELYGLRTLLRHEKLRFTVAMLQIEEYRRLDGWSRDKKRGSHRMERAPLALDAMISLRTSMDYHKLLRDYGTAALPPVFTVKEFGKLCRMRQDAAWRGLHVLCLLGVVEKCGKRGRSELYQCTIDNEQ